MLTKERKEELLGLFRPLGNISDLKPWDLWLFMHHPDYQNKAVAEVLMQKIGDHFNAIFKKRNADLKTADSAIEKKAVQDFYRHALIWPFVRAEEDGPIDTLELTYIQGLLDSDGWIWREVFRDGKKRALSEVKLTNQRLDEVMADVGGEVSDKYNALVEKMSERGLKIYQLNQKGLSVREIEAVVKCSRGTVQNELNKLDKIDPHLRRRWKGDHPDSNANKRNGSDLDRKDIF